MNVKIKSKVALLTNFVLTGQHGTRIKMETPIRLSSYLPREKLLEQMLQKKI
jgi:hypothetical protein